MSEKATMQILEKLIKEGHYIIQDMATSSLEDLFIVMVENAQGQTVAEATDKSLETALRAAAGQVLAACELPKQFNPMSDIPTTKSQAEIALAYGKDDLIAKNMIGIFRVRLELGDNLLTAYETALKALAVKDD